MLELNFVSMVSSTELRDSRAGEDGAEPCDREDAELRHLLTLVNTEVRGHNKILEEMIINSINNFFDSMSSF